MTPSPLVVVVDDQDAARFAKVQLLRRAGLQVIETATGNAALALVDAHQPDVIVLDINLPDISGIEVCRQLRRRYDTLPALQILQISNTAVTPADQVRGLEHGADAYLTEPIPGSVLVATVRAMLRVRRAEAALAEALAREREARQGAEDANRLKDEFIATLSHELRTPLNAMMGWIWQLRNASLNEESRARALESVERNARLQAELINDLLDLSRCAKGKLRLEMHVVDARAAIDRAIESVRNAAGGGRVKVQASGDPVKVIADPARLQQILGNLLANAVQYTPDGGSITASTAAVDANAVISVTDTGAGIDPAFLPHVFDQFRQGDGVLSRKHGGLGLGLTVVRQLSELHGGRVAVFSEGIGRGTTFTVTLPIENCVKEREDGGPLLAGVRALVVDRDAAEAESLATTLSASGASVATATAAADAVARIADEKVRIVVCGDGISDEDRDALAKAAQAANAVCVSGSLAFAPAEIVRAAARALVKRPATADPPDERRVVR